MENGITWWKNDGSEEDLLAKGKRKIITGLEANGVMRTGWQKCIWKNIIGSGGSNDGANEDRLAKSRGINTYYLEK